MKHKLNQHAAHICEHITVHNTDVHNKHTTAPIIFPLNLRTFTIAQIQGHTRCLKDTQIRFPVDFQEFLVDILTTIQ